MNTTASSSVSPGPAPTSWVLIGGLWSFWQYGSFDISIGFILGGVPVNVTFPVIVPPAGRAAVTSIAELASPKTANKIKNFVRMIAAPLLQPVRKFWTSHRSNTGRRRDLLSGRLGSDLL